MCTVSFVHTPERSGFRLMVNRDERRTRPTAGPPMERRQGGVRVVWPTDPESGGTWVAVNDAGLVFALLNRTDGSSTAPAGVRSRGLVIPQLADARSLGQALERWADLPLTDYAPFRLVIATAGHYACVGWRRERTVRVVGPWERPMMFTSSGLGDAMVEAPRAALFRDLVTAAADPWRGQERYHHHTWPAARAVSVLMSRPDAVTVCQTTVLVDSGGIEMSHAPMVDGWRGPVSRWVLSRRGAAAVA
ncbi:MAG: NRDE family protein [Acidobacteriota bacterium]